MRRGSAARRSAANGSAGLASCSKAHLVPKLCRWMCLSASLHEVRASPTWRRAGVSGRGEAVSFPHRFDQSSPRRRERRRRPYVTGSKGSASRARLGGSCPRSQRRAPGFAGALRAGVVRAREDLVGGRLGRRPRRRAARGPPRRHGDNEAALTRSRFHRRQVPIDRQHEEGRWPKDARYPWNALRR